MTSYFDDLSVHGVWGMLGLFEHASLALMGASRNQPFLPCQR